MKPGQYPKYRSRASLCYHLLTWILLVLPVCAAIRLPASAAENPPAAKSCQNQPRPFKDVSSDHWAARAVKQMADEGVLKGYPDLTFKGDKTVTRYGLAVALARFQEVFDASRKPLTTNDGKISLHFSPSCPKWARGPIESLALSKVLPVGSPIIVDGTKPATVEDLAQAISSLAARLVEAGTIDPGPSDFGQSDRPGNDNHKE